MRECGARSPSSSLSSSVWDRLRPPSMETTHPCLPAVAATALTTVQCLTPSWRGQFRQRSAHQGSPRPAIVRNTPSMATPRRHQRWSSRAWPHAKLPKSRNDFLSPRPALRRAASICVRRLSADLPPPRSSANFPFGFPYSPAHFPMRRCRSSLALEVTSCAARTSLLHCRF